MKVEATRTQGSLWPGFNQPHADSISSGTLDLSRCHSEAQTAKGPRAKKGRRRQGGTWQHQAPVALCWIEMNLTERATNATPLHP